MAQRGSGANGRQCDPACANASPCRDQGQDPRRGGIPVHGARVRGDESAGDHRCCRREPGRGQLPFREQGGTVPGGPHPAARSDEPGARRPSHATRARRRPGRAAMRPDPVGDVHPGVAARPGPGARRQGFSSSAWPCLCRPCAVHPQIPRGTVRDHDRAVQGGIRARAAGPPGERAFLAPAFHHGRAVLHARGNRRSAPHRRAHARRDRERRGVAAAPCSVSSRGSAIAASRDRGGRSPARSMRIRGPRS